MRSFLCCLAILCLFTACSKNSKEKKAVEDAVRANAAALQAENVEGAMATIDPKSPAYGKTESMLATVFSHYDLDYKIESLEVTRIDGDQAEVKFVQTTIDPSAKTSGFRNNRVTGRHTLRDDAGKWKISQTVTDKIEYLNP